MLWMQVSDERESERAKKRYASSLMSRTIILTRLGLKHMRLWISTLSNSSGTRKYIVSKHAFIAVDKLTVSDDQVMQAFSGAMSLLQQRDSPS